MNKDDPMDSGDFYEHLRNGGTPDNFFPSTEEKEKNIKESHDAAKLWKHRLTTRDRKFLKSLNIKDER